MVEPIPSPRPVFPIFDRQLPSTPARFYRLSVDSDSGVVVTTGASEALQSTLLAFVERGDEVVMFEPRFDIYAAGVSLADGVCVGVPLSGQGLRPDIDRLRAAITPRTKVLLLNSPHNPTGIVFTRDELEAVAGGHGA